MFSSYFNTLKTLGELDHYSIMMQAIKHIDTEWNCIIIRVVNKGSEGLLYERMDSSPLQVADRKS